MGKRISLRSISLLVLGLAALLAAPEASAGPGVLVIAKDRGAVGNQELAEAVEDLDPDYPVELLLVGPDSQGIENGYAAYIAAARDALRAQGVDRVIAIPLFVSGGDPLLAAFRDRIEAALALTPITWTAALGDSYLAREILLDRINAALETGKAERLVLLLPTGSDMALGERLLDDIRPLVSFKDMSVAVFDAESGTGPDLPAGAGGALVIPFLIDVKFTPHMSLEATLARRYGGDGVVIAPSVMPHPAVRIWLRSMINAHAPATDETIGIIVMPHGSTAPYNDGIVAAMPDSIGRYPTAFAFGMASPFTIAQAVRELEAQGVRHAVFLRLFALPHHFQAESDYILGLNAAPPTHSHGGVPSRVRTAIRFVTLGGYQEDPLISEILKDRILEVSRDPSRESVVLLSHGSFSDAANAAGLAVVERNIAEIEAALTEPFREIRAMNLREDWPDKRAEAVSAIRDFIADAGRDGRAIVVSNRLYGSGSYAEYLEGLDYVMNGQGLIPHANLTRWVETTLADGIDMLKSGAQGDRRAAAHEHGH